MNFLKTNWWEIDRSRLLSFFGAMLSLLHVITYFYWVNAGHFLNTASSTPLLCWDFFSGCASHSLLSNGLATSLFTAYLVFACIALMFFVWRRFIAFAWFMLLFTNIIKITFYVFDASLAQDIYALLIFLNIAFLFIPNKIPLIKGGILAYYFILGFKQFTPDWLSGADLINIIPFPLKGLEWVTALGIIVQVTLPLLLISPIGQRLAIGALGLFGFHVFHFYFQKSFESVAMCTLIFFFIFEYFERGRLERESLYQSYAHPEPSKLWWPIALVIYLMAQGPLLPKSWPTELLRVEGPMPSAECLFFNFAKFGDHIEQLGELLPTELSPHVRCHPRVAFSSAKQTCSKLSEQGNFEKVSSFFLTRSLADKEYKTVFRIDNICSPSVQFRQVAGSL